MHCKIFLFIITVIIISSCSKYNTNISDNSISNEEKKEILIQKKILINEMMKASQLLHQVSWPILIKNKKKCVLNNTKLYGLIYADIIDVQEKDYNIGCKLVRGAYYNQDVITDELFWKIKDTHKLCFLD